MKTILLNDSRWWPVFQAQSLHIIKVVCAMPFIYFFYFYFFLKLINHFDGLIEWIELDNPTFVNQINWFYLKWYISHITCFYWAFGRIYNFVLHLMGKCHHHFNFLVWIINSNCLICFMCVFMKIKESLRTFWPFKKKNFHCPHRNDQEDQTVSVCDHTVSGWFYGNRASGVCCDCC